MTAPIFVDTNVLVYAVDAGAGVMHTAARDWMTMLWERQTGRISVQVLQEFYVTVTRKLRPGMSPSEAQREVRALMPWWDSLIVASAQTLGCRTLLTEDLQHGQQFDDLTVVNPFKVEPPV
jgi:predicted nucleic acid-binding protein